MIRLIKYGFIAVTSMLIDYLFLYIVYAIISLKSSQAITIAFVIGATFNYIANRKFVFNSSANTLVEVIKYVLLVFFNYFITLFIMIFFIEQGMSIYWAKLPAVMATFFISFTLSKRFVYN